MKGKILFVTGGIVGYVLGARAGRKRYEQMRRFANRVWETPAVQKQVDKVEGFAADKLSQVPETISNAAKKAVAGVVDKVTSSGAEGESEKSTPASSTKSATTKKASSSNGTASAGGSGSSQSSTSTGTSTRSGSKDPSSKTGASKTGSSKTGSSKTGSSKTGASKTSSSKTSSTKTSSSKTSKDESL